MMLSENYKHRLQELAGIISEEMKFISAQEAHDKKFFGPVYNGTKKENSDKIQSQGFKIFVGTERIDNISNGYPNEEYYNSITPPIHHLGYGIYFTTKKYIAKKYNNNTTRNLKTYFLNVPKLETINFGSPKTMMEWWIKNGYDAELAKKDRVAATIKLTETLKSKFDAVYFKGFGIKRLLDGDQIVVFDTENIFQIDNSLSKKMEIGSKVISVVQIGGALSGIVPINTTGFIINKELAQPMRDHWSKIGNSTPHWTENSEYVYTIKFKKGGTKYNILDNMIKSL